MVKLELRFSNRSRIFVIIDNSLFLYTYPSTIISYLETIVKYITKILFMKYEVGKKTDYKVNSIS